jgi:apolipoprotein D and lipocalin family protein
MRAYNHFNLIPYLSIVLLMLNSCSGIPKGAKAVSPFELDRYLGVWYEIARLDMKFEKDLNNVTATYSMNENGTVKVNNQGYNYVINEWKQAIGKAKFAENTNEAKLKVSFFGPFYAAYNVIALDKDYKYALVCGPNLKYLWILSREKTIPENIKSDYLNIAREIGFSVDELIWVEHDK